MSNKVILAGIAGGAALFVWGVVAWMLLPIHRTSMRTLPDEQRVVDALVGSGTSRGLYVVPAYPQASAGGAVDTGAEEEWQRKASQGPLAVVVFEPAGHPPSRLFRRMIEGLLVCVVAAMFSAWALSRVRVGTYAGRAAFALGFGLVAWMLGPATEWIWLHYPTDYVLAALVDDLCGWAIVGAVQAGIVKG
jgi:hypothetical protein